MSDVLLKWRHYSYFPYELTFARLEVERLFGVTPAEAPDGLHIPVEAFSPERVRRLTYFARAVTPAGEVVPLQRAIEASATEKRSAKQNTRYSAHGLHEYRGKFNPQVVRAIANILGLRAGSAVLDPFCGSGTTLLEAAHMGWNAFGTDLSPLAVRIASAKLRALRMAGDRLELLAEGLRRRLGSAARRFAADSVDDGEMTDLVLGAGFERANLAYLERWFPNGVLAQLGLAKAVFADVVKDPDDRVVFEIILSDQLRKASLQDPADLRVRRRKDAKSNYPLLSWFVDALQIQVERIGDARKAIGELHGVQAVAVADARTTDFASDGCHGGPYDAVITSPPYATALPYIDTQRLSLVALGYLDARLLRGLEGTFVGARDITTRDRRALVDDIESGSGVLPSAVCELCGTMLAAAHHPDNGFRRRNMPALIWRYFRDMAATLSNLRKVLSPGSPVALVIGVNRTTLGGTTFRIDTPRLLTEVGLHLGYRLMADLSMDTYPRYGVHHRNAIQAERLVVLERGA